MLHLLVHVGRYTPGIPRPLADPLDDRCLDFYRVIGCLSAGEATPVSI